MPRVERRHALYLVAGVTALLVLALAILRFQIPLYRVSAHVYRVFSQAVTGRSETLLTTGLYDVRASFYTAIVPSPSVEGGGIAAFGDQFLLATGDGRLYLLSRGQGRP